MVRGRITPKTIPDDPTLMRQAILDLLREMDKKDQRIEELIQGVIQLRRQQFGKKSEKVESDQLLLEFVARAVAEKREKNATQEQESSGRNGHGRTAIPEHLPRDLVRFEVPKKERRCKACHKELKEIGEVVTEKVEFVPASIKAKRYVRVKYACGDSNCGGDIVLADLPPQAVEKSKAAEGMLAFVANAKYGWHLPLHRQEEVLANLGLEIPRSTLWEWVKGTAEALEPVYGVMRKEVQQSEIIASDETPVRLRDREHNVTKQGRQWAYLNEEHTVYEFTPDRKKKHPEAFLENSEATVISDAYSGYKSIAKGNEKITNAFCWAHVRRKYFNAQESDKERAMVAMAYIRALYDVEAEGKERTPSKRRKLRNEKSRPILDQFKAWLDEQGMAVLPKSPIGKAIAYTQKNWKELTTFLVDGRVRIDNNHTEQQLRPIAIGRKNVSFRQA